MKKVFFVSAIMCMAMVAFVACKKDKGQICTCYALGQNLGDFESGPMSCSELAEASTQASGYTVTCSPK